jgi:hypothetical protein
MLKIAISSGERGFNPFGDLETTHLWPANAHNTAGGREVM